MRQGKIEVICGPMFCGKTTELLRRLERHIYAGKSFIGIKPLIDTREQVAEIQTVRGKLRVDYQPVTHLKNLYLKEVLLIEEAQFFGKEIVGFCQRERLFGTSVLIAGLDMDCHGQPFGYMGDLMAIADSVTKLTAICKCGRDAAYTKKIAGNSSQLIEIGDKDKYIPCCAECWIR